MKTLLLCGVLYPAISYSQTDERTMISQWQKEHPKTIYISSGKFDQLSENEKTLLGNDIIVFGDALTFGQLESYKVPVNYELLSDEFQIDKSDEGFLKNWISSNPQIKIITRSKFESFPEIMKELAADPANNILVLQNDTLKKSDVTNSPYY